MATLAELDARISFYTGADTNNFTAAQRLAGVNQAQDEIESLILRTQDDWDFDDTNQAADPIKSINTVAGTQAYSVLTADANTVQIKRVDVSYDGTKYQKAIEMGDSEYTNANDTTSIAAYFTKVEPKYRMVGKNIYLYPIPDANVTAGIKVTIGRLAVAFTTSDYSTGTAVPGFNRQFHDAIAIKTSYDYCFIRSLNNAGVLGQLWEKQKAMIADFYSHRIKDKKYSLRPRIVNFK
jgi:hypothetical protein